MGKKRKARKIMVVTEEEAVPAEPQQRPRLVRQLSGATGVRTLSPRAPSPKADGLALATEHKKRKGVAMADSGARAPAHAASQQAALAAERPRLVRQLSGATGVRTLSPREPSPKADGPASRIAAGGAVFLAQSGIQVQPPSAGEAMVAAETFEAAAGLYGDELVAAIRANVRSPRPTPIQAVCWALAAPSVAQPRPRDLIGANIRLCPVKSTY